MYNTKEFIEDKVKMFGQDKYYYKITSKGGVIRGKEEEVKMELTGCHIDFIVTSFPPSCCNSSKAIVFNGVYCIYIDEEDMDKVINFAQKFKYTTLREDLANDLK